MIYTDNNKLVIECEQTDYTEHHYRILALINLIKTQNTDHKSEDTTYYAFNLLEDMLPDVQHIDFEKLKRSCP